MRRVFFFLKKILKLILIIIQLYFSSFKISRLRSKSHEIKIRLKSVSTKSNKGIREIENLNTQLKKYEKQIVEITNKYREKIDKLRLQN